jgi:ubiquitin C-terminal hydrolase
MCAVDSDDCARPAVGNVGLKNLCSACYLDSGLQQIFAIEPFRNFVPRLSPTHDFHQELRMLFWHMDSSNSRFVSPAAFISHSMLYDRPLDPHEQQDAVEILQDLLSRFHWDQEVLSLFAGTLQQTITADDFETTIVEQIQYGGERSKRCETIGT